MTTTVVPLKTLEYFVCGNQALDAQTIVMVAGWPDTAEVFRSNFIQRFSTTYRIVGITLPGYTKASRKLHGLQPSGWTVDQVTSALVQTLDETVNPSTTRRRPILLSHGWGCVISSELLIRQPRMFERLVLLDTAFQVAGDTPGPTVAGLLTGRTNSMPLRKMLGIVASQLWIIIAYTLNLLGLGVVAHWMVQMLAKSLKAPVYQRDVENNSEQGLDGVVAEQGYLHVQLWWHLVLRRPLASTLGYRDPLVPTFYGYGTHKSFQLHTSSWLRMLAARTPRDGSMAVPYNSGHWFFFNPHSPTGTQVLEDVTRFLEAGDKA